jgi:glycosyltransferase involved in cell wall biosynthesis
LTRLSSKRDRPKLLLLAPGGWIHGRNALRGAVGTGFDTVFVDVNDPNLEKSLPYTFIPLPRSGYNSYRRFLPEQSARELRDQILVRRLRNLWNRVAPDIVHVCWIDFRAALCARAGMTPLILSAWGSDVNAHLETESDSALRALAIEALSGASFTIVDSPAMTARCETLAGQHIQSEMLHLGVDTDQFRAGLHSERAKLRAHFKISDDDVLLSSMRAFSPLYNHDLILDAFACSLPRLRKKAYLLFKAFNAHSPSYLEMLRYKTREHGISDRIRFIDEMPHTALPSLYAATDVVINFPRHDSFPVTLLEAAACQRAVICNKLETYAGVIPDENITWVPSNDRSALADAITERANSYEYREDKFVNVRGAIVAGFDAKRYQERLGAIYRRVAGVDGGRSDIGNTRQN